MAAALCSCRSPPPSCRLVAVASTTMSSHVMSSTTLSLASVDFLARVAAAQVPAKRVGALVRLRIDDASSAIGYGPAAARTASRQGVVDTVDGAVGIPLPDGLVGSMCCTRKTSRTPGPLLRTSNGIRFAWSPPTNSMTRARHAFNGIGKSERSQSSQGRVRCRRLHFLL
jgi:hypothetical protein